MKSDDSISFSRCRAFASNPKVNTNLWRALNTGKNISAFRKEDHNASYAAITWQTIEMKVQNKTTV